MKRIRILVSAIACVAFSAPALGGERPATAPQGAEPDRWRPGVLAGVHVGLGILVKSDLLAGLAFEPVRLLSIETSVGTRAIGGWPQIAGMVRLRWPLERWALGIGVGLAQGAWTPNGTERGDQRFEDAHWLDSELTLERRAPDGNTGLVFRIGRRSLQNPDDETCTPIPIGNSGGCHGVAFVTDSIYVGFSFVVRLTL